MCSSGTSAFMMELSTMCRPVLGRGGAGLALSPSAGSPASNSGGEYTYSVPQTPASVAAAP